MMENINTSANPETLIGSKRSLVPPTRQERIHVGVFKCLLTGQSGGGEGDSERGGEREFGK